jgi:cephalosporin-C deacetylase
MPLTDMPLEKLKEYQGRNPRPADFDDYWDKALAEMHGIDPQVELVPRESASKTVDYFDLYFTGVGGARIRAKYLRPKNAPEPHPGIVSFHGYTGQSGDFWSHRGWAAEGYSVAAIDCRGQGGKSEDVGGVKGTTMRGHIIRGLHDSPEKLLYRSIYLDCAQLAGIVMNLPEVDARRVGAVGGSQGGGLTLACAALEPRIKRAAPVFPFLCDYKRVWEMDMINGAYNELQTYFKMFDWLHEREDEVFTNLGYIDCQHLAPRIEADVLMFTGLMDTCCPPSTQFAAYNKIKSNKDVVIYPDYGHEALPRSPDMTLDFMCAL